MFARLAPAFLLTCLLVGCRAPSDGRPVAAALGLTLTSGKRLVVEGSEEEGARWRLIAGGRVRELESPPVALFPVELSLSPDGRHLAVLSAGEGHPVVDVLDVARLLQGSHGARSLCFVDPYPGTIHLAGWKGDKLRLTSDRPLDAARDASGRPAGSDGLAEARPFLLTVETGVVQPE